MLVVMVKHGKVPSTCATRWTGRNFATFAAPPGAKLCSQWLAAVAAAVLLLLISAMLLPVGGPSNEWRGVGRGGSALNGMPEIFSYAPPGPFSFSRPELIIV